MLLHTTDDDIVDLKSEQLVRLVFGCRSAIAGSKQVDYKVAELVESSIPFELIFGLVE